MLELKQVLELIYTIQDKLAIEGTSIDVIILQLIALLVLMGTAYLIESDKSKKEGGK